MMRFPHPQETLGQAKMKAQGLIHLPTHSCQLSFEIPRISCLASSCSCRRAEVLPEALYHICQPPSDVSNTSGHFEYNQVPVLSLDFWPRDAPSTLEALHLSRRILNLRGYLATELLGEDGSSLPSLGVYSIKSVCEVSQRSLQSVKVQPMEPGK